MHQESELFIQLSSLVNESTAHLDFAMDEFKESSQFVDLPIYLFTELQLSVNNFSFDGWSNEDTSEHSFHTCETAIEDAVKGWPMMELTIENLSNSTRHDSSPELLFLENEPNKASVDVSKLSPSTIKPLTSSAYEEPLINQPSVNSANERPRKSMTLKYSNLEKKHPERAKVVLNYHRKWRERRSLYLCGSFFAGNCNYISYSSYNVQNHTKANHSPNEPFEMIKVVINPCEDRFLPEYIEQTYCDLSKCNPQLAKVVLKYYFDSKNKKNLNIHLCGLSREGSCDYLYYSGREVRQHMRLKHPDKKDLPVIKVVGYPGHRGYTHHKYEHLTYFQLRETKPLLAERVLQFYLKTCRKKRARVHFCGLSLHDQCCYISYSGIKVSKHIKFHHSEKEVPVYKVIRYPDESQIETTSN